MVPNGWKRKPLEKVAEIKTGVAKGKKGLKDPIDVPYLRVANVQDGYIDLSEVKTIQIERHQLDRYSLQVGDVLMTEGGDFDKLGRGDVWQGQISPCLNQNHVFAVRTNKQIVLPYFLAALSGSNYGKTYFLSCAKRSTNLASINSTQLKEFPVLIPPLPEQLKIAKILSTWDKAISTTERLIDNSKQQKKALMQQLLTGKKRLLNDSGKPFEGDYKRYSFSDLVDIDCKSLSSKTPSDYKFKYVSLSDVEPGKVSKNLEEHMYETAPSRAKRILKSGDILLSTVRPNLKGFARVTKEVNGYIASTGFAVLTPKPKSSGDYIYHYLFSSHLTGQINSLVVGSSYPAINSSDVAGLKIYCSSYAEQTKIAKVLNNCDEGIEHLEKQLSDLQHEKKALMQQLLTGKRRVVVNLPECII
ncbi:restriction endonuclease subunit S [Rheinheimera salexigens]|uniref:Type I restriction modification DNA specificity domain-containing protein n=1 Tax=Rheinheimera salexigens TaxID=1628148 RepID=A0A1E7Q3Y5_9GAMM|nr:restriction endonuclease subunit S [Rheinheimera salexigens]OEY68830.1 hypothetical protein BI198_04070 [Rheinheimera salexigens]